MFQIYRGYHRIVGYFAYTESEVVLCEGEACLIAGNKDLMKLYVEKVPSLNDEEKVIIKKTRFGEIMDGIELGALYAFDEGSYKTFSELIKTNEINFFSTENMSSAESHIGIRLVIVKKLF
jgi:hypothetical protein